MATFQPACIAHAMKYTHLENLFYCLLEFEHGSLTILDHKLHKYSHSYEMISLYML